MDDIQHPTHHTDDQLEALETYELAIERALDAGLSPSTAHNVLEGHGARPGRSTPPALLRTGWRVLPGVALDPRRPRPNPGTLEADRELFTDAPAIEQIKLEAHFGELVAATERVLANGWSKAHLHRTVDASYWGILADLYSRACDHAIVAPVSSPPKLPAHDTPIRVNTAFSQAKQ